MVRGSGTEQRFGGPQPLGHGIVHDAEAAAPGARVGDPTGHRVVLEHRRHTDVAMSCTKTTAAVSATAAPIVAKGRVGTS